MAPTSSYDINCTWHDFHDMDVTADPMDGFPYPSMYSWTRIILASVVVTAIMLAIVVGNGLVVVAIAVDRRLKGVQHWFIGSLAVSDLLVGLFIMPFSLATELMGYWAFGDVICQLWLSTDVLLCTASILNLCLISLDRYWSITRPIDYVRRRTPRRAALMISVVWTLSMVISLPPLVGWKRPQPMHLGFPLCQLSSELGYVLYSTIGSFYVPLLVMVLVYFKIYLAARARARRNLKSVGAAGTAGTSAVTMVPASACVADASRQLPVVQVELDSCDELECEENFVNSRSLEIERKRDEMESGTGTEAASVEERRVMLSPTIDKDPAGRQHPDDDRSTISVDRQQLAVEYHAVGDEYASSKRRRCSRSRDDDVITTGSADHLLPQSTTPLSIAAVNARRRAEFFGLKPLSPDRSDQVMSHLDNATSPPVVAATCKRLSDVPSRQKAHLSVTASPDKATLLVCKLPDPLAEPRRSVVVDEQERYKKKLARARERRVRASGAPLSYSASSWRHSSDAGFRSSPSTRSLCSSTSTFQRACSPSSSGSATATRR